MTSLAALDLPYDESELRAFVEEAVAQPGTEQRPRFYAVTGSHLYGFDSGRSDVDVRGVHEVPAEAYAYLRSPAEEVTVNMDGTTEGFEDYADVDLRSYELKTFGSLLYSANYNVVELVLEAPQLINGMPLEIDALRELVREHLPMNVPHAYLGMAKSNYYKHLDPEKPESYVPRPKSFLYVYRGLLGAQYVLDREDVEADVRALAEAVPFGDPALVDDLVRAKRDPDGDATGRDPEGDTARREPDGDGSKGDVERVPEALEERAREAIVEGFNELESIPEPEKSGYRDAIDDWMRKVRA